MYSGLELILLILSILGPIAAQLYLTRIFASASKIASSQGLTGAQVAAKILDSYGLSSIPVNQVPGKLTDHYDPIGKKLALSESVYDSNSLAAIAVAAHEVGHAIQDKEKYRFLMLRTACYPVVGFSSKFAPFLILGGFFFPAFPQLLTFGIVLFAISVFFSIITLPVEFDASRRALLAINNLGIVSPTEHPTAKKVLSAAALTYVASAITAILELVRLYLISSSRD